MVAGDVPDPESCRPLTDKELALVLDAASRTKVTRRVPGTCFESYESKDFAIQTILIMARTGCHASVVGKWTEDNIRGEYLVWRRPKRQAKSRMVKLLIHHEIRPFLRSYLSDSGRPKDPSAYHKLLKKVEAKLREEGHDEIRLNPNRLRHVFGTTMTRLGLAPRESARLLGVANTRVVQTYICREEEEVDQHLRDSGWGGGGAPQ